MKQSMDVTIIKSLVKDEAIKALLIDYCFKKYCNVSTDNTNLTVENRYSVGEFVKGKQYIIIVTYHAYSDCNLFITVNTVQNNLIAHTVIHRPTIDTPLTSIIDSLIKEYLIRELNSINHQLNVLGGDQ